MSYHLKLLWGNIPSDEGGSLGLGRYLTLEGYKYVYIDFYTDVYVYTDGYNNVYTDGYTDILNIGTRLWLYFSLLA